MLTFTYYLVILYISTIMLTFAHYLVIIYVLYMSTAMLTCWLVDQICRPGDWSTKYVKPVDQIPVLYYTTSLLV